MYEPPITQQIAEHFTKEIDAQVYKAVLNVGIDVDKRELIRALNYDRQQYEKGYRDGYEEFIDFIAFGEVNFFGHFLPVPPLRNL